MGNCGSSLDCTACRRFDYETQEWNQECPTQSKVNADIAGIGILVSFYFSALAVFVVVIRGYLTATLPSGLLQSTDQHALEIMKNLFKRKRRQQNTRTPSLVQTPKQQSRSHVLAKFIKMLSDQQLITGISIMIAALSSRCVMSQNEWHIVMSLAYFSATTHSLSLDVLRKYLAQHTWARYCRITFTLVFLVIFTFAFLVDFLLSDNGTKIVQCALLEWISDPALVVDEIVLLRLIPILIILWAKHISALTRLAAPDVGYHRHVTFIRMDRISMYFWSRSNALSEMEIASIIADARLDYDTKIGPSNDEAKISAWYFLEQYHDAYLSEIPVWALQFVYGTKNTIFAVLGANIDPSSDAWELGYGQVVAIGLLVLPLLALIDVKNEQAILDSFLPSLAQGTLNQINVADNSSPRLTASEPRAEQSDHARSDIIHQTGNVAHQPFPKIARKIAIRSLILCVLFTVLLIFAVSIQSFVLFSFTAVWIMIRAVIILRRHISQNRFVWKEMKSRKNKKTSLQSSPVVPGRSGSSAPQTPPRRPSVNVLDGPQDETHTTATDTSPTFGPPQRQDTEASIGLDALFSKQDGSP